MILFFNTINSILKTFFIILFISCSSNIPDFYNKPPLDEENYIYTTGVGTTQIAAFLNAINSSGIPMEMKSSKDSISGFQKINIDTLDFSFDFESNSISIYNQLQVKYSNNQNLLFLTSNDSLFFQSFYEDSNDKVELDETKTNFTDQSFDVMISKFSQIDINIKKIEKKREYYYILLSINKFHIKEI